MKKSEPGKQFDDKGFAIQEDLSKGVKVWIPHSEDGWRSASVVESGDYEHVIVLDEKTQEVSISSRNQTSSSFRNFHILFFISF